MDESQRLGAYCYAQASGGKNRQFELENCMTLCYAAAQVHFERTDPRPIGARPDILTGVHSKGPDNLFAIFMLDIPALTDNICVHERDKEAE